MTIVNEVQKEKIKKLYSVTDTEELAKIIGLKPRTVKDWAKRLGIKKQKGYIFHECGKFTKEQKRFLMKNYSTISNAELSAQLKISEENILAYACAKGLKKQADLFTNINGAKQFYINKRANENYNVNNYLGKEIEPFVDGSNLYKAPNGKYKVNQNYFDIIDNEWKAYWLGFMYADGWNSLSKSYFGIKLSIKDEDHVIKFKHSLQSDNKIYYSKSKEVIINGKTVRPSDFVCLGISNKKLCESLNELGCVQKKTYILKFPTNKQVPEYLIRHFIRGFLDGDGWVSVLKKDNTPSIGFVGMESFILPLKRHLIEKLNVSDIKPSKKQNSATVEVDWYSFVDVEKIYNYLYNGANIYMQRKFEKLNDFYCLGQYEV